MVERLLDVIALVLIGSISVLLQFQISSLLAGAIKIMAIAGAIGLGIVIVMPFQEKLISRLIAQIPLPPKLRQTIIEQMARFLLGMRSLHNVRRLGSFIFLTAIIWFIDGIGNMIGVHVISQTLNLGQSFILLAALGLYCERHSRTALRLYRCPAIRCRQCFWYPLAFHVRLHLAYISECPGTQSLLLISFWGLIGLWQVNRFNSSDPNR